MKLATKVLLSRVKNVALKVADHAVLGGAISKTTGTDLSPQGKIPFMEIAASLIPIVLLAALFAGWIDVAELKELLKIL
tara:strand:- start:1699 stop:1935 length:237 start_codon:yes stop_codon:yes gene_type:complete